MNGAREYVDLIMWAGRIGLIETINNQYGCYKSENLIMFIGSHARGKTLQMYVVGDEFSKSDVKYYSIICDNLLVYDVVSGQRGWTETYGWLHDGKWVKYFDNLIKSIKNEKNELYHFIHKRKHENQIFIKIL